MENIIDVNKVYYSYKPSYDEDQTVIAVEDASVQIKKGDFVAVLGRNGSGKSTFCRLLNALILPDAGTVYINGMKTTDEKNVWEIRKTAGMVFQNPDNQIVATIVEDDVAFGPENMGIDPKKIKELVMHALEVTEMTEYKNHAPHLLSGGQKQKVAVAGVLAMEPECIILDEATSMLDPLGRDELMKVLVELNEIKGITIILVTHHMDEAIMAKRVLVMDKGKIALKGRPGDIFSKVGIIKNMGLDVPQVIELFYRLNEHGFSLPLDIENQGEALKILENAIREKIK